MGKPVNSNVKRAETTSLNTKINREVFDNFKDYCAYRGVGMNTLLETFMRQYTNGRFDFTINEILKWKNNDEDVDTLNTPINKEIYLDFKSACKINGYFLKHVVTAFMDKLVNGNYVMEFIEIKENENENGKV